jgi:hypothetical protein
MKNRIEKQKTALLDVKAAHEKGIHWLISAGSIPVVKTNLLEQHFSALAGGSGALTAHYGDGEQAFVLQSLSTSHGYALLHSAYGATGRVLIFSFPTATA